MESLRIGIDPILRAEETDLQTQASRAAAVMQDLKDIVKAGVIEALAEVFGGR